jgi:hypothetical protein
LYEVLNILIFTGLGYLIRIPGVSNAIDDAEDPKIEMKVQIFQRYVVDFKSNSGELVGIALCFVLIHIILLGIYYKIGHPYKTILREKHRHNSETTINAKHEQILESRRSLSSNKGELNNFEYKCFKSYFFILNLC